MRGVDPREIAKSDCVVIWGTNAVATQVNLMTHAIARPKGARRQDRRHRHLRHRDDAAGRPRAARCARARTARSPAPSCTSLFRDGLADRDYMARYTDAPEALEAHLKSRDPAWAAAITGLARRARSRPSPRWSGAHKRTLLPPRLRLLAPAQRRGQHARGALHSGGDRRLGARGRRRAARQQRRSTSSTRR